MATRPRLEALPSIARRGRPAAYAGCADAKATYAMHSKRRPIRFPTPGGCPVALRPVAPSPGVRTLGRPRLLAPRALGSSNLIEALPDCVHIVDRAHTAFSAVALFPCLPSSHWFPPGGPRFMLRASGR